MGFIYITAGTKSVLMQFMLDIISPYSNSGPSFLHYECLLNVAGKKRNLIFIAAENLWCITTVPRRYS